MTIRDRIKELRRVKASELHPNPKNWRSHPKEQRSALQGILAEVGYADALIARELEDGTLELIDGHLRAETTPDQVVPVLVLDVTQEEAEKLLVTLDPLAGMATADSEKLRDLLVSVEVDTPALKEMLQELGAKFHAVPELSNIVEDAAPLPADAAITKPGDLWMLGDHRLLCGDSSSPRGRRSAARRRADPSREHRSAVQREGRAAVEQRDRGRPLVLPAAGPITSASTPSGTPRPVQADASEAAGEGSAARKRLRVGRGVRAGCSRPGSATSRACCSRAAAFYIWGGYANVANYPPVLKASGLYFSAGDHLGQGAPRADPQGLHGEPRVVLLRLEGRRGPQVLRPEQRPGRLGGQEGQSRRAWST